LLLSPCRRIFSAGVLARVVWVAGWLVGLKNTSRTTAFDPMNLFSKARMSNGRLLFYVLFTAATRPRAFKVYHGATQSPSLAKNLLLNEGQII
jgi:hypothetical protein